MRCVSEDDLLEYVERRLSLERLGEIEFHLRECVECRRLLAEVARSTSQSAPLVNSAVAARYEVLGPIGAGGMGVVYAARDSKLHRKVALKMLRPGGAGDTTEAKMRERLVREARAMARLSHANVLPIYDVGELDGDVFLAMEFVEGRTLRTWLREKRRSWRDVLDTYLAAGRGLAAANAAGVIHRDFKPDNVLVGNDGRVRVMDFGLASAAAANPAVSDVRREWQSVQSLRGTALAGSPAYMAPEQMRGELVDARADVFSYCVALHEGLYGERPFAGDSVAELETAISRGQLRKPQRANGTPAWMRRVVLRGLHAAPAERFQSVDAIIAALEKGRSRAMKRAVFAGVLLAALAAIAWSIAAPAIRVAVGRGISKGTPREARVPVQASFPTGQVRPSVASNSDSYGFYLRGKVQVRRRTEQDTLEAIRLLEQAISLDPNFAAAHAELAAAYGQWIGWFAPEDKTALERAEIEVAKALRLGPDLAEAHWAAGSLLWVAVPPRFAHDRAVREFKRAVALDPNFAMAHQGLGNVYLHIGLFGAAVTELQKAVDLEPTIQYPMLQIGSAAVDRGDYEEALRILHQVPPESNPSAWYFSVGLAQQYLGRSQESWTLMEEYLRAHPKDRGGAVVSARAIWFAKIGDAARSEADIHTALEDGKGFVHFHHTAYNIASAYALLGRSGPAVEWLRAAAEGGYPSYPHFASDPNLERIRSDAGYTTLMRELKAQWERYQAMF